MVPIPGHARVSLTKLPSTLRTKHVDTARHACSGIRCSSIHARHPLSVRPIYLCQNDQSSISTPLVLSIRSQNVFTCKRESWQISNLYGKRWFASTLGRKQFRQVHTDESSGGGWTTRTIQIPVGGNGNVTLDINDLESSRSDTGNADPQARDILIYLPAGPLLKNSVTGQEEKGLGDTSYDSNLHSRYLSLSGLPGQQTQNVLPPVILKINYRLSPRLHSSQEDHRFPTPIHDVAVAFEWILKNQDMLRSANRKGYQPQSASCDLDDAEPRIFVFGSHIGGSLALMLALTQPNEIHAVAAHNPITEWVGLDETVVSTKSMALTSIASKKRNKAGLEETRRRTHSAANALINLRTQLFRNASGFFDAFASPLLFLRAPGRDTPFWRTARPEIEPLPNNAKSLIEAIQNDGGIEASEDENKDLFRERGFGPYDDDWHIAEPEFTTKPDQLLIPRSIPPHQSPGTEQTLTDLSRLSLLDHESQPLNQRETDLSPQPEYHALTNISPSSSRIVDDSKLFDSQAPTDLSTMSFPTLTSTNSEHTSSSAIYPHSSIPDPTLNPSGSSSTRRRKVLRRWPPLGRPEDVDLPYVKIYSTLPLAHHLPQSGAVVDLAYILHPQAKELVDVMRRACFWGRESGLGDERVVLKSLSGSNGGEGRGRSLESREAESEDLDGQEGESEGLMREVAVWFREIGSIEK